MFNDVIKLSKFNEIIGLFCISCFFCMFFCFMYFCEPIGDDILGYFDGSLSYYLDETEFNLGNRFTNFAQIINELLFIYFNWSGRITGYFFNLLGKLFSKTFLSFFSSVIFFVNIYLSFLIVCKDKRKVFEYSFIFLILFSVIYWYRKAAYYEYMWTMVTIYSLPCCLILLYYLYSKVVFNHRVLFIIFQIFGCITGLCHEVLSLLLIIIICVDLFVDHFFYGVNYKVALRHLGLLLGYILCFSAPGNFHRLTQSHDSYSTDFIERFRCVLSLYKNVLLGTCVQKTFFLFSLSLALLVIVILVYKRRYEILKFVFLKRGGMIVCLLSSLFIFSFFSHYPIYGMDLSILLFYIIVFSFCYEYMIKVKSISVINIFCSLSFVIFFIINNYSEIDSYIRTSHFRMMLIDKAVKNNEKSIEIPRYSDSLSQDRFSLEDLNGNSYDSLYYKEFYHVHLIVK